MNLEGPIFVTKTYHLVCRVVLCIENRKDSRETERKMVNIC